MHAGSGAHLPAHLAEQLVADVAVPNLLLVLDRRRRGLVAALGQELCQLLLGDVVGHVVRLRPISLVHRHLQARQGTVSARHAEQIPCLQPFQCVSATDLGDEQRCEGEERN